MSVVGVQNFLREREVLLGALLFVLFITYKTWIYSISGLRNKKITVWNKGVSVTTLKGKKAVYFSLFWFVIAVLLTLVLSKLLYVLILRPEELL